MVKLSLDREWPLWRFHWYWYIYLQPRSLECWARCILYRRNFLVDHRSYIHTMTWANTYLIEVWRQWIHSRRDLHKNRQPLVGVMIGTTLSMMHTLYIVVRCSKQSLEWRTSCWTVIRSKSSWRSCHSQRVYEGGQ